MSGSRLSRRGVAFSESAQSATTALSLDCDGGSMAHARGDVIKNSKKLPAPATVSERTNNMAKPSAIPSMMLSACAALLAVAAVVGCGGASGGTRGTGGATGNGGSSGGLGGRNGGVGGSVTAGVGGMSTALDCPGGVDPAAPLLVDFSPQTWMPGAGKWSPLARDLTGSKVSGGGNMTLPDGGPTTSVANTIDATLVDPNFEIMGTVVAGDYGFGLLALDKCINTHTYTGVQFTIGGTTGGCDLYFLLQTFDQQGAAYRGGCTSTSCYAFPRKKIDVTSTPTPTTVYFTELENTGMPATADAMKAQIVGFQWQLQSPPPADGGTQLTCTGIDLTIDNVGFATGTP
jgi:hypothetical protein